MHEKRGGILPEEQRLGLPILDQEQFGGSGGGQRSGDRQEQLGSWGPGLRQRLGRANQGPRRHVYVELGGNNQGRLNPEDNHRDAQLVAQENGEQLLANNDHEGDALEGELKWYREISICFLAFLVSSALYGLSIQNIAVSQRWAMAMAATCTILLILSLLVVAATHIVRAENKRLDILSQALLILAMYVTVFARVLVVLILFGTVPAEAEDVIEVIFFTVRANLILFVMWIGIFKRPQIIYLSPPFQWI